MIIDGLPVMSSPQSGDEIPIERGTATYKIDYDALATAIINRLGDPVGISHGGSGLSASPSLLVNLSSASADTVMKQSPRPGVYGTLPVANGGTGKTNLDSETFTWTPTGYIASFSGAMRSWFNVHTITIGAIKFANGTPSWTTVATLPSGHRPQNSIYSILRRDSEDSTCGVYIGVNGNISLFGHSAGVAYCGTIVYVS